MATKRKPASSTTYCVERYEKTGAKRVVKRGLRRAEAVALATALAKKFPAAAFVASRDEERAQKARKARKR